MKKLNLTERRSIFDQFRRTANQTFSEFAQNNRQISKYLDRHRLHIDPPLENDDDTGITVQVRFGNFPVFGYGTRQSFKNIVEEGASLNYSLNDDGYVNVLLYPCGTDNIQRKEKLIILSKKLCPSKLQNKRTLKFHFQKLCRYMENTSVFGDPSLFERLSQWVFRISRPTVVGNLYQSRKIWTESYSIIKFVISVGLSGFLIFGIQKCSETNEVEKAAILLKNGSDQIEKSIERSNELQEKIIEELVLTREFFNKANAKSDSIEISINTELQKMNKSISKPSNEQNH